MERIEKIQNGWIVADRTGKHTAFTFTTKDDRAVWISNTAVKTVCGTVIIVAGITAGLVNDGVAAVGWLLRGSIW
jgi:predicted membrane GTPase involved in stress response